MQRKMRLVRLRVILKRQTQGYWWRGLWLSLTCAHRRSLMKKAAALFSLYFLFCMQASASCYFTRNVTSMSVNCERETSVDPDRVCKGLVIGWSQGGDCKYPLSRYKGGRFSSSCGPTNAHGLTLMFNGKIQCIEK